MVNQQPAHQAARSSQQPTTTTEERNNVINGRGSAGNNTGKVISSSDATQTTSSIPYKLQKVLVEGKMIPCINMKPNSFTDMLVSIPDLVTNCFNNVPVQSCQQVMQILGLEVVKANP